MKMMVSKRVIAVFVAGIAVFAVWGGFAVVDFIQMDRTRQVFDVMSAANAVRAKQGNSLEAAEGYVATLQTIDRTALTPEMRRAFDAYLGGFEEKIALTRDGQDTARADAQITAAYRELVKTAGK